MEATQSTPANTVRSTTHPLLLVAAASVTVLSLAGVATLAGWLPGPGAHGVEPAKLAAAAPAPPVAPAIPAAAPISIQQTVTAPPEKTRPVAKTTERAPAPVRYSTPAPAPMPAAAAPSYGLPPPPPYATTAPGPLPAICRDCGVVEAVREVPVEAKGSGGGAVAGGIVGGIVGNQIGKGATRDLATILGAVGGAYAGNHIEKSSKDSKRYDVIVRFEDGSTRTFSSDTLPAWQSGDRVRLQNGTLTSGASRSAGSSGVI